MSAYDIAAENGTDVESRTERALTECMTVLPDAGGVYTVVGENGGTYSVDARDGRCTCPDHKHRDARCKHIRRVAFATGERAIPAGVDGVDEQLGAQTDTTPRAAATDGGSPADEVLPDSWFSFDEGDDSDGECACSDLPDDIPCADCYISGDAEWEESGA